MKIFEFIWDMLWVSCIFGSGLLIGYSIWGMDDYNQEVKKETYMITLEYGYLKGFSRGLDSTFLWKKDSTSFENNFIKKK